MENPYNAMGVRATAFTLRSIASEQQNEITHGPDRFVDVHDLLLLRAAFLLELHAPAVEQVYESPEREASSKAMGHLIQAAAQLSCIDRGDYAHRIAVLIEELQAEFYPEQVPG